MPNSSQGQALAVALFSPGWPPGRVQNGIVTYVGELAPSLAKLGFRTTVVSARTESGTAAGEVTNLSEVPASKIQRVLFRVLRQTPRFPVPWTTLSLVWRMAVVLQAMESRGELDLLEMEESFGAAWFLRDLIRAPIVVRLHGPWFVNGEALGVPRDAEFSKREHAERRCIVDAAGVTSPSRDLLERVRQQYGLPLADARVIPNAAPRIAAERQWSLEDCDRNTVLFVGRFDRHKGGDIMLEAFRSVAAQRPGIELQFVGPDRGLLDDDGKTHDLESFLARSLPPEVRSRVRVRGPLPAGDIETLRRKALVTVVASRYENFGLALLEALAFGCPTVASAVGGNTEILLDEKTGLLFRTGDQEDLARQILRLLDAPERAAELGAQAAVDMASRLSPESVAVSTADYYRAVHDRRVPSAPSTARTLRQAAYKLSRLV